MATRRLRAAKKPRRAAKARPNQKATKKRPAAKRASKAAAKANASTKRGGPKSTSRRPQKPAAFDEAETQKVPSAEVVEDIEIQLSLDLLPND